MNVLLFIIAGFIMNFSKPVSAGHDISPRPVGLVQPFFTGQPMHLREMHLTQGHHNQTIRDTDQRPETRDTDSHKQRQKLSTRKNT